MKFKEIVALNKNDRSLFQKKIDDIIEGFGENELLVLRENADEAFFNNLPFTNYKEKFDNLIVYFGERSVRSKVAGGGDVTHYQSKIFYVIGPDGRISKDRGIWELASKKVDEFQEKMHGELHTAKISDFLSRV